MRDRLSWEELRAKTILDNVEAKWYQVFDKNIFDDVKVIKNKLYKKRVGKRELIRR